MTFDDMKAMLKDVAEILKEKGDAGADAVWVWLDLAGAKGETLDEIAAIEARLAPQGIELLNRYGHLVRPKPWVGVDFDGAKPIRGLIARPRTLLMVSTPIRRAHTRSWRSRRACCGVGFAPGHSML